MDPSNRLPLVTETRSVHGPRWALILSVSVASHLVAQQRQQPTFRTSSAAVVVDVVARDDKQRPVPGLRASDF